MSEYKSLSPAERDALNRDFFSSLHCALPGNVVSFDAENQTAEIQPAVRMGSLVYPVLADVPVFYTHLDQEMMQATAEDLADVFQKVDTAARKSRWQKMRRLPDSVIIQFPAVGY